MDTIKPFGWRLCGTMRIQGESDAKWEAKHTKSFATPLYELPAQTEFQVCDADGVMQAASYGPRSDALREAMHYAAQYAQDGPVTIVEVLRVHVDLPETE